jgi:hypothetical protein
MGAVRGGEPVTAAPRPGRRTWNPRAAPTIPTTDTAQPVVSLSYFPVMLLSGVLGASAARRVDLAVLAGWAIATLLASLRLFQWEPRAAR